MNTPETMDRRTFLSALVMMSSLLASCGQGGSGTQPQESAPTTEEGKLGGGDAADPASEPEPEPEPEPIKPAKRKVYLATVLKESVAAHGMWPAKERVSTVAYDEAGRVVHRVADSGFAGYVITADYAYDAEGNVIGATIDTGDAGSDGSVAPFNSTWTAYWSDDHRSISWESNETPYGSFYVFCNYYADGKLASKAVSLIGPQAGYEGSAQFVYNERGLLTEVNETPQYGQRTSRKMTYDQSGRLISYNCEADNESCTYSYNSWGKLFEKRLILRDYIETVTCAYDDAGILLAAQRTTSDPTTPESSFKTRPQASCTFVCDEEGNVVSGSRVVEADGLEDTYTVEYEVREIDSNEPAPCSAISLLDPTDPYPYLDEFYVLSDFSVFSRARAEEYNARWLAEFAAEVDATDAELAAKG